MSPNGRMWHEKMKNVYSNCNSSVVELQAKLQASDKRPFDQFGFSISLDDESGILAVGAANQVALDQDKIFVKPDFVGKNNSGEKYIEQSGSVFLFKRTDEIRDGLGKLLFPPYW